MIKRKDDFGDTIEVCGIEDIIPSINLDEFKKHSFTVLLTDEDWKHLQERALDYRLTPSALIQEFITDLVYSDCSNGSDERDKANDWASRASVNWR
jgi:hypothetical protein